MGLLCKTVESNVIIVLSLALSVYGMYNCNWFHVQLFFLLFFIPKSPSYKVGSDNFDTLTCNVNESRYHSHACMPCKFQIHCSKHFWSSIWVHFTVWICYPIGGDLNESEMQEPFSCWIINIMNWNEDFGRRKSWKK